MMTRRMMLNGFAAENWDYIILPSGGESHGKFPVTSINVASGKKITVKFAGIINRSQVTLIDGYFARTSPEYITYCSSLTADNGQIILTTTRSGDIYFGNARTATVGSESKMSITYIKIRIEDAA